MEFLESKVGDIAQQSWWETQVHIRKMQRTAAIVHELTRLLSVATNYKFFVADSAQTWYLPEWAWHQPSGRLARFRRWLLRRLCKKHRTPVWGQRSNPVTTVTAGAEFTQPATESALLVNQTKYYEEIRGYKGEPVIDFPDNLSETLDSYFLLKPTRRLVFSRACQLYGQAMDIWLTSRSLSLASLVFRDRRACPRGRP